MEADGAKKRTPPTPPPPRPPPPWPPPPPPPVRFFQVPTPVDVQRQMQVHAQLEEAKNLFAVRRGVLVPPPRRAPAEAQPARKPPPGTPQKAMPRGGEHGPAEAVLSPGAAQSPPLKKQRAGDEGLESHGDGGGDRPRVHSSGAQVLVTKDGRLHMMPKPKLRAEERGSTEVGVAKTPGVTEQMGPTATVQPQQMGARHFRRQCLSSRWGRSRWGRRRLSRGRGSLQCSLNRWSRGHQCSLSRWSRGHQCSLSRWSRGHQCSLSRPGRPGQQCSLSRWGLRQQCSRNR